jgi:deoxyribodipyrimidine photo-lyase
MVEKKLKYYFVPFILTRGIIKANLQNVVDNYKISTIITDFSPLKISKNWLGQIKELQVPIIVVDTHNIIPCWVVSTKQEYSARTIRPKIYKLMDNYFTSLPRIRSHTYRLTATIDEINWQKILNELKIDFTVMKFCG